MSAELLIRLPDYFPSLIDAMQDGFILRGIDGTVVEVNASFCAMIGYDRSELVGSRPPHPWWPAKRREQLAEVFGEETAGTAAEDDVIFQRRSGERFPGVVTNAPLRDSAGQIIGYIGTVKDMSERVRAEAIAAAQYDVARRLSAAASLREGLLGTLEAVATALDWQFGAFWIIDELTALAHCSETWHAQGVDGRTFEDVCRSMRFERGIGLPGRVWAARQVEWIADVERDDQLSRRPAFLEIGIRSAIGIPVQIGVQIVGVVELFADEPRPPDRALLVASTALGSQVGQFIERKRVENALRESEDRFRTMADSAPVMLWVSGPDGLRDWHNTGWLDFTSRTIEEELGNGWAEGLHPDDFNGALETYLIAFNGRTPYEMEYRLRRHDGEYCWLLERAVPRFEADRTFAGYIGSCIDISDRKRHEEEQAFLAEATRELASSLDFRATLASVAQLAVPAIADWCVIHALDEGGQVGQLAVAHADPAKVAWSLEIQERYPPDLDGQTGIPRVIRTGQPEVYPHIPDEMIVAAARDEEHLRLLREVGFTSAMLVPIVARERVLGVVSFVSAELGRHYGAFDLALARQLADRAAVAIDNALLYQEAQEAAKARDQFLAVAAHELRSPLTSMKGFAQLLLRRAGRLPGGDDWVKPLQTIDAQINRVTELVSRLLDVSRIEEKRLQLEIEPVDLVEVVRAAAVEAQLATERHVVAARFADESLVAPADRTRIAQVLANLLDNAIKYSPEGGQIEVVLRPEGDDLVVSVSDQGAGISPDARDRLFERYFRGTSSSRSAGEGLGLGLYVAHGIVDAHGGRMWLESEEGHGSTFSFSLPRDGANRGAAEA